MSCKMLELLTRLTPLWPADMIELAEDIYNIRPENPMRRRYGMNRIAALAAICRRQGWRVIRTTMPVTSVTKGPAGKLIRIPQIASGLILGQEHYTLIQTAQRAGVLNGEFKHGGRALSPEAVRGLIAAERDI